MLAREEKTDRIVGSSTVMRRILSLVDTVAQSDCNVLIEGESGTGKELIACRLHQKSNRHVYPFIPVNCAGITSTLFESQLFGHVRGAFTGAEQSTLGLIRCADQGTLFLDEIGEIPMDLQPKLLRVIQEREVMPVGSPTTVRVNVRFVAATNRSLQTEMENGRFRADLYYRLNVVRIHIPPLRERREDILALIDHFLNHYAEYYGRMRIDLGQDMRRRLMMQPWGGNVRQVASWVERLYVTGISPEVLLVALEMETGQHDPVPPIAIEGTEEQRIREALRLSGNNRTRAAKMLGIHRGTLLRKMNVLDIH